MHNVNCNIDDYVIMLPQARKLHDLYINTIWGDVRITSNVENAAYAIASSRSISDHPKNMQNIVGNITIILEENAMVVQNITDVKFLRKDDSRYIPGVENTVYYSADNKTEFYIYQYPFKGFVMNDIENSSGAVVSSTLGSLNNLSRFLFKKIMIRKYISNGYNSLHASAVEKDGYSYIFLAGGRAGKTTMFMNLILNGFNPINDDVVFVKRDSDSITCHGITMLPSVRKESLEYLPPFIDSTTNYHRGFEGEYYCDLPYQTSNNKLDMHKLKAIFIPKYGYDNLVVEKASDEVAKKYIIKSMNTHQELFPDNESLIIVNCLLSLPIFTIKTTADGIKNFNGFVDFLSNGIIN